MLSFVKKVIKTEKIYCRKKEKTPQEKEVTKPGGWLKYVIC